MKELSKNEILEIFGGGGFFYDLGAWCKRKYCELKEGHNIDVVTPYKDGSYMYF